MSPWRRVTRNIKEKRKLLREKGSLHADRRSVLWTNFAGRIGFALIKELIARKQAHLPRHISGVGDKETALGIDRRSATVQNAAAAWQQHGVPERRRREDAFAAHAVLQKLPAKTSA